MISQSFPQQIEVFAVFAGVEAVGIRQHKVIALSEYLKAPMRLALRHDHERPALDRSGSKTCERCGPTELGRGGYG